MKTGIDGTNRAVRGHGGTCLATGRDGWRRWALLAGACALALGCAAANADAVAQEVRLDSAASGPRDHARAGVAEVRELERWNDPDLSLESVDSLRRAAQAGDLDAAIALASRLIDRYERGGTSDDLFEAVLWMDRYQGADSLARSGLLARVQQRGCGHPVLRLHWLCDVAE